MIRDSRPWPEPDKCEYSYKGHTLVAIKRDSRWVVFDLVNATIEYEHRARAVAVRELMDVIDSKLEKVEA